MTEAMDTEDQKRGEIAAATLKSAGRTVQQTTYPRFDPMNERTYFGWTTNPATMTLGDFLKAHCPAKRA